MCKTCFIAEKRVKSIWIVRKKSLLLHPLSRENGGKTKSIEKCKSIPDWSRRVEKNF